MRYFFSRGNGGADTFKTLVAITGSVAAVLGK